LHVLQGNKDWCLHASAAKSDCISPPVRKLLEAVSDTVPGGLAEDDVELLQTVATGLRNEAEDEEESDDEPGCVVAESASRRECLEQPGPGDSEQEVEAPGC